MAVKMKRSAVEGKVPTTTQLELGELAVNTYDGKLYFKKDDGVSETIVKLGEVATVDLGLLYLQQATGYAQAYLPNGIYTRDFTKGVASDFTGVSGRLARSLPAGYIPVPTSYNNSTATGGGVTTTSSPPGYQSGDLYDLLNAASGYFSQYTSSTWTVTFDLGSAVLIGGYVIERFNSVTYQPVSWSVQYSDNNSTWYTIDSHQNETADWGINTKVFQFSPASHRYWRFVFTANNGSPAGGWAMYYLNIFEYNTAAPIYTSETFVAAAQPSNATLRCRATGLSSPPVSGADIKLEVSRDDGTTWTTTTDTMTSLEPGSSEVYVVTGECNISSQPSGTDMKFRISFPGTGAKEPATITDVTLEWE